jgi:glycosyltransferase involved in cell wall biosynthesis
VFFINDNGCYAGAGIATGRQAQAFALNGHHCTIMPLNRDSIEVRRDTARFAEDCKRAGLAITYAEPLINQIDRHGRFDPSAWIEENVPQDSVVIVGNIHSSSISPKFILRQLMRGNHVFIYAHDLDFATGGCAYPQYHNCEAYKTRCLDKSCLKPADHYPESSNENIEIQHIERQLIAEIGEAWILANSDWTATLMKSVYPKTKVSESPLGVNTKVFRQCSITRRSYRESLGIGDSELLIAVGADSLSRKGKGGETVEWLINQVSNYDQIRFVSFGHASLCEDKVISTGYTNSESEIARIFQAADIFINPASIEAFGQTAIEAAACGCPVLCLAGSGLESAVKHRHNGLIGKNREKLLSYLLHLYENRETLESLQDEAAAYTAQEFSLERLYINWCEAILSGAKQ